MNPKPTLPKMLEGTIERNVLAWAKAHGVFVSKLQGQGNRSLPDRIFWIRGGKPILIEFKRPGGKPTPLQLQTIAKLEALGYRVFVCDNAADAKAILLKALAGQ